MDPVAGAGWLYLGEGLFLSSLWIAARAAAAAGAGEAGVSAAGTGEAGPSTAGALLIVLGCLGWAVDSNVTASIAGKDPTAISLLKGWAGALAYLGGGALFGRTIAARPHDLLTILLAGAPRSPPDLPDRADRGLRPLRRPARRIARGGGMGRVRARGDRGGDVATDGRSPGLTMGPGTGHGT